MIAHQLPNPGTNVGQAGQALRHSLAKVIDVVNRRASAEGGLAPVGTYDDLIATLDAAVAAIEALQDVA